MYKVKLDTCSDLKLELSSTVALAEIVNSPRALTVYLLIKYEEYDQLVDLSINASDYSDRQNFSDDYLITEVLRKSPNLPTSHDREASALDSFVESELKCYYTNERILSAGKPVWFDHFRNVIFSILGPLTASELELVHERMRFGPGASTGVRGTGGVPSDKIDAEMHLTEELYPFYRTLLGEGWWEHQSKPVIVQGSKFTTVPKSAKTDRGICIEPTLNIFGQLGVGHLLRRKLRLFGLDLNSQAKNQKLAAEAYRKNLCTIDLSAASDSISWGLVLEALPPRWTELLTLFRSHFTTFKAGEYHELEKFSSMGNGYTFELESLIFYALVRTIVPKTRLNHVSVYGDDLIVPAEYGEVLIERLKYLGFKTNGSKSFLAGNFFESCGTDWFMGHNVRPFYFKGSNKMIPYAVQIANKLRLYASRTCDNLFADSRFRNLYNSLLGVTPFPWNTTSVPEQYGDLGIIKSYTESMRLNLCQHLIPLRYGTMMRSQPVKRDKRNWAVLLHSLMQKSSESATYGREPVRGYLRKAKTKRVPMYWYPDGLDWL